MKKLIALSAIMVFLASCGAKKSIAANSEVPAVSSNKSFYDAITKKSDFDALKITSKIDAEVGKFSQGTKSLRKTEQNLYRF